MGVSYTRVPAIVEAIEIQEAQRTIKTATASYHGKRGDFQIVDELGDVSIVPRDKFLKQYKPVEHEPSEDDGEV